MEYLLPLGCSAVRLRILGYPHHRSVLEGLDSVVSFSTSRSHLRKATYVYLLAKLFIFALQVSESLILSTDDALHLFCPCGIPDLLFQLLRLHCLRQ